MALYIQGSYVKPKKTTYIPSSYYSSAPKAPVQALWSDKLPSGGTPSVYNTTGSFKTAPTQTVAQIPTGYKIADFLKDIPKGYTVCQLARQVLMSNFLEFGNRPGLTADNEINSQPAEIDIGSQESQITRLPRKLKLLKLYIMNVYNRY